MFVSDEREMYVARKYILVFNLMTPTNDEKL